MQKNVITVHFSAVVNAKVAIFRLIYKEIIHFFAGSITNSVGKTAMLTKCCKRKLAWGRRVPEAADKIAFYRVKVFLFELF